MTKAKKYKITVPIYSCIQQADGSREFFPSGSIVDSKHIHDDSVAKYTEVGFIVPVEEDKKKASKVVDESSS